MNKLLKGAIAGAAGVALLLGGAGTFALWNDATVVSGGTIATGTLSILPTAALATWTDISSTVVSGTSFDPSIQRLVPGDKVKLTKAVTISTTGKNLKANLSFDPTTITTDPALSSVLSYTLAATPVVATGSASVTQVGTTNTFTITPGSAATTTVNVTFTVEFLDTTGTTGQSVSPAVDLTKLKFTLTQVRP